MPLVARAGHTLAVAALTLAAACGSVTDPVGPDGARGPLLARRPPKPAPSHTPILFVHGWNATGSTWTTMVGRFKKDGWTADELANFSYNTAQSNATTAGIIAQKVDSILAASGATKVTIVTHSMGALSARHYVRYLGGEGKVDALVSLGGPNHGTSTAYLCLQVACREMLPGSTFLGALNQDDETWGLTTRYATWWSACDEVINPQTSTILAAGPTGGVANTQTACMRHSQLHEDATVYAQVRDWVNQPLAAVLASR